jgi:hypothetical protein
MLADGSPAPCDQCCGPLEGTHVGIWMSPGQHLIGDGGKRPDVPGSLRRLAAQLLGRHVPERAHQCPAQRSWARSAAKHRRGRRLRPRSRAPIDSGRDDSRNAPRRASDRTVRGRLPLPPARQVESDPESGVRGLSGVEGRCPGNVLTTREIEVLALVAQGISNQAIHARRRGGSYETNHLGNGDHGGCVYKCCVSRPQRQGSAAETAARVGRGHYLVASIGCEDCHMPKKTGPNGPEPDLSRMLSGHPEGTRLSPTPTAGGPWAVAATWDLTAWSGPWGVQLRDEHQDSVPARSSRRVAETRGVRVHVSTPIRRRGRQPAEGRTAVHRGRSVYFTSGRTRTRDSG